MTTRFSRRKFLGGVGSLIPLAGLLTPVFSVRSALAPLSANDSAKVEIAPSGIPVWAEKRIAETMERINTWRGEDVTVLIPAVTDVHSETMDEPEEIDWSDTKNHLLIAQRAAVELGADFLVDLGDIGLDRYSDYTPRTPEDIFRRIVSQIHLYQDFDAVPVFFAIGNHDHGNDAFHLSNQTLGQTFNGLTKRRGVPFVTGPDSDYGYYDLPEKKCRAFILNSSDDGYYGFSQAQLQFLADHLVLPEGWTAIIFQHFCVNREVGLWNSSPHIRARRGEVWTAILEDFIAGKKGEADGVKWDFTSNRSCRLAGCVTGDSHFDNQGTVNGLHSIITQGFGRVQISQMPDGSVNIPFDPSSDTLIDVVAIKPFKGEIRLFRIGAGGMERDRSFSFPVE